MSFATLSPSADTIDQEVSAGSSQSREWSETLRQAHEAVDQWVANPANDSAGDPIVSTLMTAGRAVAQWPRSQFNSPMVGEALALAKRVRDSGLHVRMAASARSGEPAAKGWPGLIATMVTEPAWRVAAPTLDLVPEWLVEDYAAWLFAVPDIFVGPGQADAFARHMERHLECLARWSEVNPGAAVVAAAMRHYRAEETFARLKISGSDLRRLAESHARIFARTVGQRPTDYALDAFSREARKLRIGIVRSSLDDTPESWAALALFAELDPERAEASVFVIDSTGGAAENFARQHAHAFQILGAEAAEQARTLGDAGLDIVVFADELTGSTSAVAKLAIHRFAPLQIVTAAHHGATSGFGAIDLCVIGDVAEHAGAAEQFTERLGVVRGLGTCFAKLQPRPEEFPDRTELGLPTDGPLFLAVADWAEISPETQRLWARLLGRVPGSRLLIQHAGGAIASETETAVFGGSFDRALQAEGVATDRLILSAVALPNHAEVERLVTVADVYLDPQPSGRDAQALAALQAGVPVVTLAGETLRTRRGAALLRSLGVEELVAKDESSYLEIAEKLISDAGHATRVKEILQVRANALPRVLDPLAAADGLMDLLEHAFDERVQRGAARFRSDRRPLRAQVSEVSVADLVNAGEEALKQEDHFGAAREAREALRADPGFAPARALLGRALSRLGQYTRAVSYLLPSVEAADADAARWFDLARALEADGRRNTALQALETSLRLDPKQSNGWLMLIELAEAAGIYDLAREALDALRETAPDHPQISVLAARLG